MFQIALRGIRFHPFRYLATAIAIVLGVAFFIATSVVTGSFRESLNDSISESFSDVDAAVRSTDTIETEFIDIRSQIPATTSDRLADVPGVAAAEPYLAGYAQIVTADGKTVNGTDNAQGFAWIDSSALNPYAVIDGRAPTGPSEVVVDADTFTDGGFALGEQVRILPLAADDSFEVVGVITADASADFGGQTLGFSFDGAATVLGTTDVDQIFVAATDGTTQTELVANLQQVIGADLEAVTGTQLVDEFQDLIGTLTSIINIALQIFAGIALFVGAFVIYNTFSITVAQRTKEMALLRAIGASGRQVTMSVLVEAIVIGLVAATAGAAAGIGLGWVLLKLLGAVAGDFDVALSIPPGALVSGLLIGLVITVVAAVVPARRGARIAPIEALRESAVERVSAGRRRSLVGIGALGGGLVASVMAVNGSSTGLLAIGLPLIMLAVVLLGPVFVGPAAQALSIPFVRNGSVTGELARENTRRNPKRTATTSLTLTIGIALMVTATVFASTLSTSLRGQLEDQIQATDIVEISNSVAQLGGGLDPTITTSVGELDGVDAAVAFRSSPATIDGDFAQVTGTDTTRIDQVVDLDVTAGAITDLGTSSIAVSTGQADNLGVGVGDAITVEFPQTDSTLTVAAIYDRDQLVDGFVVDNTLLTSVTVRSLDTRILVTITEDTARQGIDQILAADPTASLKTSDEFITDQAGAINQLLILLYGLLAMSVVVALIGIVNTMALSIHERTRELGLLRAVGMTRTQLRRTVRIESTLVALMGTSIGLALGMFFGWLAQQAAGDTIPDFAIPYGQLAFIAVVGVVAGVVAGILPARRAGRLDILDAIATE